MKAIFKSSSQIIPAILYYVDSHGPDARDTIGAQINHGLNKDGTCYIESRPDYCAGVIGALADMGEGDLLISAA